MTTQEEKDKERNQQIAENEEVRQITGSIRVSAWAVVFAIILGTIAVLIGWGWLRH